MKKAGLITIAIVLVAAGIIWYYKSNIEEGRRPQEQEKGTLVKEYREWKKYYI